MKLNNQEIVQSLKKIAGQKFTWFAFLMACLTFTAFNTRPDTEASPFYEDAATPAVTETSEDAVATDVFDEIDETLALKEEEVLPEIDRLSVTYSPENATNESLAAKYRPAKAATPNAAALTEFAQTLLGRPYNYGGTTPAGFDCSGFVYYVFTKFDKEIERSSRTQSTQGTEVAVEEAVPGDLIFFTGTNAKVREVGHVGIIISEPGEAVSFIHSSSNGGVKISALEGYYSTRYMFTKRMN